LSIDCPANVALRVNPDFELKSSGMKMSGGPKPFGIDSEMIPEVLNRVGELSVQFRGFHVFTGAQNLRSESICEAQVKSLELALELAALAPSPPQFINIGGGFGIPYFPGDEPLDISSICENLKQLSTKLESAHPGCELMIELGRYLVGEAGVYVSRIMDKKVSRGHTYLVTDGGLHHHLSASGNFGQVIRKNYPLAIANKIGSAETEVASVVGPLCTPLDLLGHKMELAKAEIGDLVAVFQSGAYGYTASPHLFLSHPPPLQLLL
jgi:diaminopimelate decarboxylase